MFKRTLYLFLGILLSISSGSVFIYPTYSYYIKTKFNFSLRELNLYATFINIGVWVGFGMGLIYDTCGPKLSNIITLIVLPGSLLVLYKFIQSSSISLLWFLLIALIMGQGSSLAYTNALSTNVKNFSKRNSSNIVGLIISNSAIAPSIFASVKSSFSSMTIPSFIAFVIYYVLIIMVLCLFWFDEIEEHDDNNIFRNKIFKDFKQTFIVYLFGYVNFIALLIFIGILIFNHIFGINIPAFLVFILLHITFIVFIILEKQKKFDSFLNSRFNKNHQGINGAIGPNRFEIIGRSVQVREPIENSESKVINKNKKFDDKNDKNIEENNKGYPESAIIGKLKDKFELEFDNKKGKNFDNKKEHSLNINLSRSIGRQSLENNQNINKIGEYNKEANGRISIESNNEENNKKEEHDKEKEDNIDNGDNKKEEENKEDEDIKKDEENKKEEENEEEKEEDKNQNEEEKEKDKNQNEEEKEKDEKEEEKKEENKFEKEKNNNNNDINSENNDNNNNQGEKNKDSKLEESINNINNINNKDDEEKQGNNSNDINENDKSKDNNEDNNKSIDNGAKKINLNNDNIINNKEEEQKEDNDMDKKENEKKEKLDEPSFHYPRFSNNSSNNFNLDNIQNNYPKFSITSNKTDDENPYREKEEEKPKFSITRKSEEKIDEINNKNRDSKLTETKYPIYEKNIINKNPININNEKNQILNQNKKNKNSSQSPAPVSSPIPYQNSNQETNAYINTNSSFNYLNNSYSLEEKEDDDAENYSRFVFLITLFRRQQIMLLFVVLILTMGSMISNVNNIKYIVVSIDSSKDISSTSLDKYPLLYFAFNSLTRIVIGRISNELMGTDEAFAILVSITIMGFISQIFGFFMTKFFVYLSISCAGMTHGGIMTFVPLYCRYYFSLKNLGTVLGFLTTGNAIGSIIIATLIFPIFYHKNSTYKNKEEVCLKTSCFRFSYGLNIIFVFVAICLSYYLYRQDKIKKSKKRNDFENKIKNLAFGSYNDNLDNSIENF